MMLPGNGVRPLPLASPRQRIGIVTRLPFWSNVCEKSPALLTRGRQAELHVAGGVRAVALLRAEERPVAEDRAAEAATEVVVGVGQRHAGLVREVAGGAPARPVLEATTGEAVGARPRRDVERTATGAARLGVVLVHLHRHVVEGLDARVGRGAVADVADRHAVDQVVVAAARAAAERQQRGVGLVLLAVELRVARGDHRRQRDGEEERRPAAARQRRQLLGADDAAARGVRRVDERRRAGDGDRLLQLADFERDVDRGELLRRNAKTPVLVVLKPAARRAPWCLAARPRSVLPLLVRDSVTGRAGAFVDQRHRHAGNDAVRV